MMNIHVSILTGTWSSNLTQSYISMDYDLNSERLASKLSEAGIITSVNKETCLKLSDDFQQSIERWYFDSDTSREAAARQVLARLTDSDELVTRGARIAHRDPRFVSVLLAVDEYIEDITANEAISITMAISQLYSGAPKGEGAPEGFIPVRGGLIPTLIELYGYTVVYVWRYDCDPCDVMREEFESLVEAFPDEIALLAVYGPDWAETIYEKYNVKGAPTTLFLHNGEVVTRLVGAHYSVKLEREIERLYDGSSTTV